MEILEMIAEWRKGCSLSGKNAINCPACTEVLIDSIEQKEKSNQIEQLEQARIIGMSAEREALHLSKIALLERKVSLLLIICSNKEDIYVL